MTTDWVGRNASWRELGYSAANYKKGEPMTEIRFQLQQTPSKKWRLTENKVDDDGKPQEIDRGLYDSPALGHEAVKIILDPPRYYYDPNGEEIKDAHGAK